MKWLKAAQTKTEKALDTLSKVDRDARYTLSLFWLLPVLIVTTVQAFNNGWFDSIERPIFSFFNNLPTILDPLMYVITQFGGVGSVIIWFGIAWLLVNKRAAWVSTWAGVIAWIAAKFMKIWVGRDRPDSLADAARIFGGENLSGFGFPSGHSAFVAAVAGALFFQVEPKYRKYLLGIMFMVGVSRMYLGAHFPLDIVGGWALGGAIGALVSLIAGNSRNFVSVSMVKKALTKRGYETSTVKFLQLDARGSRPLYVKDVDGNEYFCKLFGSQEHAADLLFKIYRLFRFKDLQAEEPYLNGRRNVEIESFAAIWARKAGVQVPDLVDLIRMGKYWLLVQQRIEGRPLDEIKKPSKSALENIWKQVKKLHDIPIAHRDLRAANILVDKTDKAWLIDFGFAETSPLPSRMHMDNAELLMSMAVQAGVAPTVAAAHRVLGESVLAKALPYVQKSVFSGATNTALRKQPGLLQELREALHERLGAEEEIEPVTITRINGKRIINIAVLGLVLYVLIPQFESFKGSIERIDSVSWPFIGLMLLCTAGTYVAAALVYTNLSSVPLGLRQTSLVQLAASFMSKLLPGTVATNSMNARYLVKSGLEPAAAAATVLAQGLLGTIMFIVPFTLILLVAGQNLGSLLKVDIPIRALLAGICVLVILATGVILLRKVQKKLRNFVLDVFANLKDVSASKSQIVTAAAASLSISMLYIICLYSAAHALNVDLSPLKAILAYAVAIVARTAVPTPGGLGPFEIALAAALTALGVGHATAISVTVLYRLVTFWAPIPFSVVAYLHIQKKKYI